VCDLDIFYQPGPGKADELWWLGSVRNISHGGVGIVISRRLEVGAELTIELESMTDDFRRTVAARIVHRRPHKDEGWFVGCAFATPLAEEELQALLLYSIRSPASSLQSAAPSSSRADADW
jgi:hypothetical protein